MNIENITMKNITHKNRFPGVDITIFAQNLSAIIRAKRWSKKEAAIVFGYPNTHRLYDLTAGNQYPQLEELIQMSNILEISIDTLVKQRLK